MCSVVGCDSWRRSALRFKLPEDPERRLQWVQFLFEVNGQRLRESSWTDITICREHFTEDCFVKLTPVAGTVQLRCSAAPSLCVKAEPEEPEPIQEPEEAAHVGFHCDQLKTRDSPSSFYDGSGATSPAQQSPVPSEASDAFMYDYGQILQKIENIDVIREKAALLHKKGRYVVNESRLFQLFGSRCPSCGSNVKVEKFTYGLLIVLNQRCLQCDYRNQWKSQVSASVPAAEEEPAGVDVTPMIQQAASAHANHSTPAGVSEIVAVIDEEDDPMGEMAESGEEGEMDSDEDWNPVSDLSLDNELQNESDEESEYEDEDFPSLAPKHSQLCTDCGMFFNKRKPHTCEHKMKPFSCNICGKRCVSEIALTSHSRIHNENYEHRCKYCNAAFKTKVDKHTHEQTHLTEGKPYKCSDCSETFATNKERRVHLEDHRGPPQLKCHICGIEFNRCRALQRHLAVHTGERPFKCSVCQRGFNQASHLKSHMRLHTGERPYKCQRCDKCFNHNVSLKSHIQRYHSKSSGRDQDTGKKRDAGRDAQENGSKTDTHSGLDSVEDEHGNEEEEQKERIDGPNKRSRSTGRPVGRPKSSAAGEPQGQCSITKTAKEKKLKRARCSDEDSEGELTDSDASFDSAEEKVTSSTSGSRGRTRHSDRDSDFDPEDSKRRRCYSQDSDKSSGRHRGRPRKDREAEDT